MPAVIVTRFRRPWLRYMTLASVVAGLHDDDATTFFGGVKRDTGGDWIDGGDDGNPYPSYDAYAASLRGWVHPSA